MANERVDVLSIRQADRPNYEALLARGGPLPGEDLKVAFLLTMALGFADDRRADLVPKKYSYIRESYLSDEERTVINSLAVRSKNGLGVLADKREVYSVAERFAAGGIQVLRGQTTGEPGSFEKRLEAKLVELASHVKDDSLG
jgi:hypothetical protein